jgi:hypothetical protein
MARLKRTCKRASAVPTTVTTIRSISLDTRARAPQLLSKQAIASSNASGVLIVLASCARGLACTVCSRPPPRSLARLPPSLLA